MNKILIRWAIKIPSFFSKQNNKIKLDVIRNQTVAQKIINSFM